MFYTTARRNCNKKRDINYIKLILVRLQQAVSNVKAFNATVNWFVVNMVLSSYYQSMSSAGNQKCITLWSEMLIMK